MRSFLTLGVAIAALSTTSALAIPALQGPSSSQTPYLTPTAKGWSAHSLLTVGDAPSGFQMAGIPDGLGAFDNGDGTITILMNHEIAAGLGAPRAHGGANGAFVSLTVLNKDTLAVSKHEEFAKNPLVVTNLTGFANADLARIISRLCSADLPELSAFYNEASGKGYNGRIFMNGEESGSPQQRAFGWVVAERTGYELAALGRFAWENAVANPGTGDKTVVAGGEDGGIGTSKFYLYVGDKKDAGSAIDKAGLTGGTNYTLKIVDANGNPVAGAESRTTGIPGAAAIDGASLVRQSSRFALTNVASGTGFARIEDLSWDPNNSNVMYFVTTDQYDQVKDGVGVQVGRSRLWRVTFDNASNPTAGGKLDMLLDGSEELQMMDNITVGEDGKVYIQEDVGNQQHLGKIWVYDPTTGSRTQIFQHDQARFGNINIPAVLPFNLDEESSGIIEVTDLFRGSDVDFGGRNRFFLADVQAHYRTGVPATVEGGQLLLLIQAPEPGMFALFGLGVVGAIAARRRRG